jgi:hypothetical protein
MKRRRCPYDIPATEDNKVPKRDHVYGTPTTLGIKRPLETLSVEPKRRRFDANPHTALIETNARLERQCEMMKEACFEAGEKIGEQRNDIAQLRVKITQLESLIRLQRAQMERFQRHGHDNFDVKVY